MPFAGAPRGCPPGRRELRVRIRRWTLAPGGRLDPWALVLQAGIGRLSLEQVIALGAQVVLRRAVHAVIERSGQGGGWGERGGIVCPSRQPLSRSSSLGSTYNTLMPILSDKHGGPSASRHINIAVYRRALMSCVCDPPSTSCFGLHLRVQRSDHIHAQVPHRAITQSPNSVHPMASTVSDCLHRDIVATRAQSPPVRVSCMTPAATPCTP